jgi:hypothetical protein
LILSFASETYFRFESFDDVWVSDGIVPYVVIFLHTHTHTHREREREREREKREKGNAKGKGSEERTYREGGSNFEQQKAGAIHFG